MTTPHKYGKGILFVLLGSSGAGKNTLIKAVTELVPSLMQMPTATTRSKRADEIEGVHRFFLSAKEFDRRVKRNDFIEWQWVHGNRYGTLKSEVERGFLDGKTYIADVEVLGAESLKRLYSENVVLIFVAPSPIDIPNLAVLEERIRRRGDIPEAEIQDRLGRTKMEYGRARLICNYEVVNDDLNEAVSHLAAIVKARISQSEPPNK